MQRKHLEFYSRFILGLTILNIILINEDKFDWETMGTRKIKVIFSAEAGRNVELSNDYGTRIQIKCHQTIERKSRTHDAEKCVNWEFMDSFGIKSEELFHVEKFYYSVNWRSIGLRLTISRTDDIKFILPIPRI